MCVHSSVCVCECARTHVTVCTHTCGCAHSSVCVRTLCMALSVHTHVCACVCTHLSVRLRVCMHSRAEGLTARPHWGGLPGVCSAGWLGMGAPIERDQAGSRCLRQVRRAGQRALASALVEAGDCVRKCGLSRVAGTLCWRAGKAVVGDQLSRSGEAVEPQNSPVPFLGTTIK